MTFFSVSVSVINWHFIHYLTLLFLVVCLIIRSWLEFYCSSIRNSHWFLCIYASHQCNLSVPNTTLILVLILCSTVFNARLAELNYAITLKMDSEIADGLFSERPVIKERSKYILAKSYFDVKEYSRYLTKFLFIMCVLYYNNYCFLLCPICQMRSLHCWMYWPNQPIFTLLFKIHGRREKIDWRWMWQI